MDPMTITFEEYEIACGRGFDVPHLLREGESAEYTNGIWTITDRYGEAAVAQSTTARELGALLLFIEWDGE